MKVSLENLTPVDPDFPLENARIGEVFVLTVVAPGVICNPGDVMVIGGAELVNLTKKVWANKSSTTGYRGRKLRAGEYIKICEG